MTRSRSLDARTARFPALVVAVGLAVLAAAPDATAEPRLLLLPIVVHSAEDPEYLRAGLSDMLASRFERIGALDLVRAEADGRGTTDPEKALALARKSKADYVLYGSFTRFGQGASLDVQCAPATRGAADEREPLREIFVHSGSIGEIIPDLDELAGKVSRFVRGERVASGVPAAPGGGAPPPPGPPGAPSAEFDALRERVELLEAALEVLRSRESAEEAEGVDDLR